MTRASLLGQVKRGLATASVIAGGLIAVTALVRPSIAFIDQRYVRSVEYRRQRELDSIALVRRVEANDRRWASVDTSLKCLRNKLSKKDCEK